MRADMGKVLVERPRPGSRAGSLPKKGYRSRARKALEADETPRRERMKERCGGTRFFNEHLGPLRRFIDANVGRPWDKVYSEICQHVDRGNVVQKHILTHLFDYVATHVVLIDGKPCWGEGRRYGEPLAESRWWAGWYVCPRSGLLRRIAGGRSWNVARRESQKARNQAVHGPSPVVAGDWLVCCWNKDGWDLVELAPMVHNRSYEFISGYFHFMLSGSDTAVRENALQEYGKVGVEVSRRRLTRKELKNYPIPVETWAKHRDR